MAQEGLKISEATLRSILKGSESLPIVDSDLPAGRTTIDNVKAFVQPDLTDYITTTELEQKGYETSTHASNTYQPKGNYALKTDIPTDYATKDDIQNANIEELIMYGVELDKTISSPDGVRIGNMTLHKTLPVHSMMRGCLLNDDGTVNKYLNETDWTTETRDGSQGQVMVEVPEHWWKFVTEGNKFRPQLYISPISGSIHVEKYYVSAYEASVQRSTSKLCSVVNEAADYRGGNNTADWDGTYRSLLGKPATNISRTNFKTYARNRNQESTEWNCMTYSAQKDLYWLFVVEYATLNTQKAYNGTKTSEGYAQGGLGNGVTNVDYTSWSNLNNNNPFIPCGYTDSLGNGTGQIAFDMPAEYGTTLTVQVPRYRGIENPFGHIWQWTDGINVQIEPGDGLSKVFVCDDPSKFNDSNYDGYKYVGNEARTEAYVKSVIFGEGGEIMPDVVGGSSSTFFCDYHYTNIPASVTLRGVLLGGLAHHGADAGFACANSGRAPSFSLEHVGSRLCFIPENT